MKKLLRWLSWRKIIFLLILGTVIFQNRIGVNEYLSGWDNLHPEINFKLEISRGLSVVWQEFRGLGHLGGMGHVADLSRTILLWIVSFVVPSNYLRWVWHMGMLALGPIGMWYLTMKLWKWSESASLVTSAFYLLNLATVQYFYTPYESFSGFYGFLPWLISMFTRYLKEGNRRDLLKFLGVSILATTAFYVQTLFVVYVLILGIISLTYLSTNWKRVLTGWTVVFMVNAFWLLPVMYFVVSNAGVVGMSKINSVASPETAHMNEAMGGWRDVLSMRGFWLEYLEWKGNGWGRLLQVWQGWVSDNIASLLNLLVAGLSIFGTVMGVIKKRISSWVILVFGLTYFMLASNNPPIGFVYSWLIGKVPFFGEMFRSVFTKWSAVMAMVLAMGLGVIVEVLERKKLAVNILAVFIIGVSGYIVWPVFQGSLVFDSMKVEFPDEYRLLYRFFDKENKSGRVVYLPSAWMWGWQVHDWGYSGSGFLWYGIEQPILDRAFDVWSPYNEGFYNEFSDALYREETGRVRRVLDKYDVGYVLLDESVIAPGQDATILRIEETKKIAEQLGWKQTFREGALTVWETGEETGFVSTPREYTWVEADTAKVRRDVVYEEVGTYISENSEDSENSERGIIFPFAGLMREEITGVEYQDNSLQITANKVEQGQELVVPGWEVGQIVRINYQDEVPLPAYKVNDLDGPVFRGKEKPEEGKNYILARVSENEEWSEYRQDFRFQMLDSRVIVEVGGEPFVYDFGRSGQGTIGNCDVLSRGMAEKSGNVYIADERGAVCDYVVMSELDPRLPYLMRVRGENIEGRSVKFFLWNTGSKRNDLEYLLGKSEFDQAFTMLPWSWDGFYTLNIETRSFGQRTENIVEPVEVRWLPLSQIAGTKLITNQTLDNNLRIIEVSKTGTWLYKVKVEGQGLIKLSQGYDAGWVAIKTENSKFKVQKFSHVKVDGWANGWEINSKLKNQNSEVIIFYWPQLLEYVGLIVLVGTGLGLLLKKRG